MEFHCQQSKAPIILWVDTPKANWTIADDEPGYGHIRVFENQRIILRAFVKLTEAIALVEAE